MKNRSYHLRLSATAFGALALVAVPLFISPALAQVRPTYRPDVPALDSRSPVSPKPERTAERERGKSHLAAQLPAAVVDFDPLLDAPKFIRTGQGFLTGPNGQGRGVSALTAQNLPANDPVLPIKAFLNEHHDLFGFGAEVLSGARVKRDYVDKHNGLHTIVWEQQLDGIPLYQSVLMGHITRQGELTSLSSLFVPDLAASADAGTPGRGAIQAAPPITAAQAVALAARNLGMNLGDTEVVAAGSSLGEENYLVFKTPEEAYARLVWLPLHRSSLRLGWETMVTSHATKERFRLVIDAQTGEVRVRETLTAHISDASYNVFTSDSPSPFSPGLQTPGGFQPPLTNRFLIVTPALDTTASPEGWIPDGTNTTTGNNVDAFVDRNFDQQPDRARPVGVPDRVFDFPLDLTLDPTNYIDAATTQLFWRANWYHDRLYQLGFTEAAGNYQQNNFGRGGFGNDNIICYVQSGADVGIADNSMFSAPPDGQHGECFMFVFSGPNPQRDGALDSEVVCHELTHGTSWRLVGGGNALGSLQGNGMGEGWSDFYALSLLGAPSDNPDAAYPMGGYVTYLFAGTGMTENYYFGIRHFPYCTDMSKNPFTFKDIDPGQISPHAGVPRSPIYPFSAQEADEVHHQGEVWCVTLWEVRANLVAKYGWTQGNELMLQLVTDGLKLTPPAPNFLEARDAILLADQIDNAGANVLQIWKGFAKRGMGFSARSPNSSTTAGVVEAFDLPGLFVDHVVVAGGNGDGIIDFNECNDLTIFLGNNAGFEVTGVSGRLSCSTPGVIVVKSLAAYPIILDGATNGNLSPFRISTSPAFVCGTPLDCTLVVKSDQLVTTNQFRILTGTPGKPLRFDNSTPAPIPDLGETNSIIVVSNVTSALNKVTVALHITHTFDADLLIQLISPDGTTNTLSANNGSFGNNYGSACSPDAQRTTFDDDALLSISAGSAPFVGSYQPQTPLAVFIGKAGTNVNGNWRLRVADQAAGDIGTIQCWSLILLPSACKDGGGECPGADLDLSMIAQPDPVVIGNRLTYTMTVTNHGPSAAKNVAVTHQLPSSVIFVSAVASQGTCSASGGVVNGSLGTLTPGSGAIITVVGIPSTPGAISSTATASSDQSDPDTSNNSATVISRVNPASADLVTGISATPNPLVLGGTLTYTVTLTNRGPSDSSGVTVANALPASVAVLSATITQGSISPGGSLWTIGSLPVGAGAVATITVVPTQQGTITATSTAQGNQLDPLPANNTATVTTVVGPAADLAISLTGLPDPTVVSSNVTYLVSVSNLGPSPATDVSVNDFLPANVPVLSTNATQGAVSISGTTLSWTVGALASGARATLTIVVATTTNGVLSTSATVSGAQTDPNLANNSASATTVVAAPFLSIAAAGAALTFESGPTNGAVDPGETVTMILRLRDTGNISTRNLVATLLATNGVVPVAPNNPQTYGILFPSGFSVGRPFSFTASGVNGGTISPTLQLQDGTNTYPPVSFSFALPNSFTFANTNAIIVPDPAAPNPPYPFQSGPAKPYPSTIAVSNLANVLGKVTVTLSNLNYSYPGDVNALLVAPNGASCLLMSHAGDQDQSTAHLNLTFDDSASSPLPEFGQLASGTWQPTAYANFIFPTPVFPTNAPAGPYPVALSALNGANPNGTWLLYVYDDRSGDAGAISNGWSLVLSMITPVNLLANLNLTASATPTNCFAGEIITYTFTATNIGPNPASSVAFTNTLPAGTTLISASSSQGSVSTSAASVVASLGNLNAGQAATVTVQVVATPAAFAPGSNTATLTSTAVIAATENDVNPGNNSTSVATTVNRPVADVGMSLTVAPDPVFVGWNLTNTVVITNGGPGTALEVVLSQPLPPGAGFNTNSSSSTGGGFTVSNGTVFCALGNLATNSTATVSLVLTNSVIGLMTNTLFVATGSQDTNSANNAATYVATVIKQAPKIINVGALLTYESGPVNGAIDIGETVTLSLSLANAGAQDTVNLKATLQPTGGVTPLSGPQYYGSLVYGGPSASRSFHLIANPALGGATVATLALQDEQPGGTNDLGTVAFTFGAPAATNLSNSAAITIPNQGSGVPYPSTINVSGLNGQVTKATITLYGLTHMFPRDINALLVSPTGGNVLFMSHVGGGHAVTNPVTLTFDGAAASGLSADAALASGTYQPSSYPGAVVFPGPAPSGSYGSTMAAVNGHDPNGVWSLYVFDDTTGDGGLIVGGWSLTITHVVPVNPIADLVVSLSSVPNSLLAGGTTTNTIWVTNLGPSAATGVMLTDTLSSGGQATANIGNLAAGAGAMVTFLLEMPVAGGITNTATVTGNEVDPNPENNSARTITSVLSPIPATLSGSTSNGEFNLIVFAQPGSTYVIETSTNLTAWLPLSTNTASPGGTIKFTDTGAPGFEQRFYRTRRLIP
jgi:uncharacterized repeat protein (TIGR01451 family)